ncbi:hypothetical protein D3C75_1068060 [compost metagenome]
MHDAPNLKFCQDQYLEVSSYVAVNKSGEQEVQLLVVAYHLQKYSLDLGLRPIHVATQLKVEAVVDVEV